MNLSFECRYRARISEPKMIGVGPFGLRMFFEVAEGTVEGGRVNGRVLSGGGDWALVSDDGFARMDVRAQFETDDGAIMYGQYFGLIEMNDAIQTALAEGTETNYEDHYFRVTPRMETGDPRYAWVNQRLYVARGRFRADREIEYELFVVE